MEDEMQITTAQRDQLRRIRQFDNGQYEIAATRLSGNVLHMFTNTHRIAIWPDGRHGSDAYGIHKFGRFGTLKIERPIDHLEA